MLVDVRLFRFSIGPGGITGFLAEYTIDPLPANTHYIGPWVADANPCECNTVTYSMISACGVCQNRTYEK